VPGLVVPAHDPHPEIVLAATGTPLVWRVRDERGLRLELTEMLYNWRLTIAHLHTPMSIVGAWCFFGKSWDDFARAARAAHDFDPTTQAAPGGYDKEVLPWRG
jgi:hypothetical protein